MCPFFHTIPLDTTRHHHRCNCGLSLVRKRHDHEQLCCAEERSPVDFYSQQPGQAALQKSPLNFSTHGSRGCWQRPTDVYAKRHRLRGSLLRQRHRQESL